MKGPRRTTSTSKLQDKHNSIFFPSLSIHVKNTPHKLEAKTPKDVRPTRRDYISHTSRRRGKQAAQIREMNPAVLPVRTIPGSYGLPLLGPLKDRLDYFWFDGEESFFRKRMNKYGSTVFKTNIPPTFPFFSGVNPQIIALLDCNSFSTLFDISLVEKKDCLIGDFMPSVDFTGKIRVLAYLDPTEKAHFLVKSFAMDTLKRSSSVWASEFKTSLETMLVSIENEVSKSGKSSFVIPLQKCIFQFLCKSLVGADPASSPEISESGYAMLDKWLALQLLPTVSTGVVPQPLEEIFLHSWAFPYAFVKSGYEKLYEFVAKEGREAIERAERDYGLSESEICHNLLFILGFNAFGGFSVFLPTLISTIGRDETGLQEKLREEARRVVEKNGGVLSFKAIGEMELVKSTVYEVLRLNPPVKLQFARARKSFQLTTQDSAYAVQKGEMLCGYQPLAMKDPRIFDDPDKFVADRFMQEPELLNYLFWSNGPQTVTPSVDTKQCPAKDYVVATACLLVAEIFLRYDSFRCDASSLAITSLQKK